MYEGHHFVKICNEQWVFDITEFIGYKVVLEKDKKTIKEFKPAFTVIKDHTQYIFEKHISVPVRVLKESLSVIEKYEKEAFIFG